MSSEKNSAHAFTKRRTILENAADCLASHRDTLRSNQSSVRKDILNTFHQQMGLLRAREGELLRLLDEEVTARENQIDNQQKELYKLIRQCDSTQDPNLTDFLNTLSHVDLTPKSMETIQFEKDLVDFRAAIANFGKLRVHNAECQKFTGETLPVSMEDYEDDNGPVHKSVHMLSRQTQITASPAQMENIRKWLGNVRDINQEDLFKLVPEEKTDSEAETNSLCSSFDVVQSVPQEVSSVSPKPNQWVEKATSMEHTDDSFNINWPTLSNSPAKNEEPREPVYEFTTEFLKTLKSDVSSWLLHQTSGAGSKPLFSEVVNESSNKYEFQNVMQSIHDSSTAEWFLSSCSEQKPCSSNQQDEEMNDLTPRGEFDEVDETLAKNLEMLAIFSIRSGSQEGKCNLPVTNQDIDAANVGDPKAKKKLIAFGHHLWSVMHK